MRRDLPKKGRPPIFWALLTLGTILLLHLFFSPGFFHLELKNGRLYGTLIDILNRAAPVMLLSLGMTLVIATGGIDLSVGAVMAIAGATAASLLNRHSNHPFAGALGGLLAALLAGAWNGALVALLRIQPIVATLILMVTGRGIAQLLTNGQIVTFENRPFEYIGRGNTLGIPFPVVLVLIVFAAFAWFARHTAYGLFLEATGDNETASRYAGVQTARVKFAAYLLSGLCAGFAGLIVTADIKAADSNNAGLWLELDAILAVVIGGTSLLGGRFFLAGSLVGAILIQTVTTSILTMNLPVQFTLVVKAVVVIIVCLLPSETFRNVIHRRFASPEAVAKL